jgi:hypothetical protein
VLSSAVLGALLPAIASAQTDPTVSFVADDLARRRVGKSIGKGLGFAGVFGTLCCLTVVVIIVIAVLMLARRRKR